MKNNLFKILALGAIAISMGACSTEKAKTVGISELLTINAETKGWELEGQLVKIENLVLQGKYGNTLIGGATVGNTIVDLRGVEIQAKKMPEFKLGSGYGADITAVGRVKDVNGRLTLQDAKVTVNSERDYDNPPADGSSKYSGGLSMSYCPAAYLTRSLWDTYFGRTFSGALYEGTFQLASVPGTLSGSADTSFQVVFPGENLDLEDTENYSLIKVNVPGAVSETAIEKFNGFFSDKKVGDFITLCGLLQYDLEKNLGMGYVVENFWQQAGLEEPSSTPDVYYSWDYVDYYTYGYVTESLPYLASSDETAAINAPFSYLIDTGYVSYDPAELFGEGAEFIFDDTSDCALVEVIANIKPSAAASYLDAVKAACEAEGYLTLAGSAEEGGFIFGLAGANDEPLAQLNVVLSDSESYVTFDFIAPKFHHTAASIAAEMEYTAAYFQVPLTFAAVSEDTLAAMFAVGAPAAEKATDEELFTAGLTGLALVPDFCSLVDYGYAHATDEKFVDMTGVGADYFYLYFADPYSEVLGIELAFAYNGTLIVEFILAPYPAE